MSSGKGLKRSNTDDGSLLPPPTKRKPVASSTTQKAVHSFFTPASKKDPEQMSWRVVNESLLIGKFEPLASRQAQQASKRTRQKIAAFDFDSTLITPLSNNKFSKHVNDWRWWTPSVPSTLKQLHEEGYLVTVLSNQAGITLKSKSPKLELKRLADFKQKAAAVFAHLEFPISIYAATDKDYHRKPRPGMWTRLLEDYSLEDPDAVDLENSLFVGDAGGREAHEGGPKDHSCSDRNFASNLGLQFSTPEEYFLKESPRPFIRSFDPTKYLLTTAEVTDTSKDKSPLVFSKNNPTDIVMFCGSPGSGKSTFYWRHLQPLGYKRVNQDILKSRDKCLKVAGQHLQEGESVVVDNTNADPETRAYWIDLAKKHGVPIRCILFTADPQLCEHNDTVRAMGDIKTSQKSRDQNDQLSSMNPENRTTLPKIAFFDFAKRYREPQVKEGFEDITRIDFKFEGTDAQRTLWSKFWVS